MQADGEAYAGEFRDGAFHGVGTYGWPGGALKTCEWRDGRPVERTCVNVEQATDRDPTRWTGCTRTGHADSADRAGRRRGFAIRRRAVLESAPEHRSRFGRRNRHGHAGDVRGAFGPDPHGREPGVASAATDGFDAIDPATEEVNGELASATAAEVDEAVAAARRAQKEWDRMNGLKRAEALHEVARRFRDLTPRLAEALTREMGKPYKESAGRGGMDRHRLRLLRRGLAPRGGPRRRAGGRRPISTSSPSTPWAWSASSCRSTSPTCCSAGRRARRWAPATP